MTDLERRVAGLERRLDAMERGPQAPTVPEGTFWALEGLKEQLAEVASGGVLFTGAVRLPGDKEYEWQYATITDELLASDWTDMAETFAALGHGLRLRLLREVLGGRSSATELAELDDVGTSGQIYHHLRQLTAAGWLRSAGRGRYEVPAGRVVPLLVALTAARPA
ncbi:helix-turn-helix domain-containing protein [Streptomyces sp. SID14478]|uniref:helix-turn-helix domain-containing protein n=1 Tax=Streptomyces sp. SID14478 TaxID=2706073 RepID=UPI0013DEC0BB|nr:helix-turn-helix domain-containing protein [Streptomyces sp. SID14478]NEB81051.1 helix-turn-helix domain-containing protein [Streptomyces sp. SID14478]